MSVLQPDGSAIINGKHIPADQLNLMIDQAERGEFAGTPGTIYLGLPPRPDEHGREYAVALDDQHWVKLHKIAFQRNSRTDVILGELIDAL